MSEDTTTTTAATESAEDKAARIAAADAEHMPDVEAFENVVNDAVEAADTSTGTVSASDLEAVAQAYHNVTGGIKYKNLAKAYVNDQMKAALPAGEYTKAVSFNEISDHLLTTKAPSRPSAPKVDPAIAYAERIAALEVAREVLAESATGDVAEWEPIDTERAVSEALAYVEWDNDENHDEDDEPELSPIAAAAVKLVQGKGMGKRSVRGSRPRRSFTGTRRNVAAHIASAFADLDSGEFLTVGQIVAHNSDEYGDDHPSSGAVSARLDSETGVDGVEPSVNAKGVRGAIKV